jgi:hypothetical protein
MNQRTIVTAVALALAFPAALVSAAPAVQPKANSLLGIDSNRAAVIDGIVAQWGSELAKAGVSADSFRTTLEGLRADQLLTARLAGSLSGLYDVIDHATVTNAPTQQVKSAIAKSLGDAADDTVYTPVTPCRLVETRGTFLAVYEGGGPFSASEIRPYVIESGNGACLTQLPSGLHPSAVQLQVFGIPVSGSGDIEILPEGAAFGSTSTLIYLSNVAFTSASTTARVNLANNEIAVQVRTGSAHVAIDLVGYFAPPNGGLLPQDCEINQVPQSDGAGNWACATVASGATGATGPAGADGAPGAPGVPGAPGAQGPTGPAGADGAIGAAGPTGATGSSGNTVLNGSGVPDNGLGADGDFYIDTSTNLIYGPKASGAWPGSGVSIVGPAGATGAAGAAGAAGPQGIPGIQGIQGIQGPVGATGPAGADGAMGATGATGATGASVGTGPLPVTVQTGNYALLSTDYTVFCASPGGGASSKTITLPSASANTGKVYVIKRTAQSPNSCSISGVASAEGDPYVLNPPGGGLVSGIMVQSDGTSWWILSNSK